MCGVLAAPPRPPPPAGAEACRASLRAWSPPWTRRSGRPTRRLPLPFPLGVFSEPTTPLRGFTRDPPHPQLGGGRRLPPSPGRRHPMSSAFENPDKGPACSPTRPREPSQGLRGARARMCLHWAPRLVYLLCSPGPRGGLWASRQQTLSAVWLWGGGVPGAAGDRQRGRPRRAEERGGVLVGLLFPAVPLTLSGDSEAQRGSHTAQGGAWVLAAPVPCGRGSDMMPWVPLGGFAGFSGCRRGARTWRSGA